MTPLLVDKGPVVLFNHGYGVSRGMYTALMSELASRGFVVVTADFLESPFVEFPDGRTYKPLMSYIALRSVKQGEYYVDRYEDSPPRNVISSTSSTDLAPERRAWAEDDLLQEPSHDQGTSTPHRSIAEEAAEFNDRFINPSLVAPLRGVWIADKNATREGEAEVPNGDDSV